MKIYMVSLFHRATINEPYQHHYVMLYELVSAWRVPSVMYRCSKDATDVSHFISNGRQGFMKAARPELTVAAGLICVEDNMYH